MIKSKRDKRVADIRTGRMSKGFPADLVFRTQRRLAQIDAATGLNDLAVPPSNRLEALSGNRRGQHSIRINRQWHICFVWADGDAYDVEIVDYH